MRLRVILQGAFALCNRAPTRSVTASIRTTCRFSPAFRYLTDPHQGYDVLLLLSCRNRELISQQEKNAQPAENTASDVCIDEPIFWKSQVYMPPADGHLIFPRCHAVGGADGEKDMARVKI